MIPGIIAHTIGQGAWSIIGTDPFSGSSINDVVTGAIGSTQWWVSVGDGGKFGVSSDKGKTWTILTTTTSENLNVVLYDSTNEEFWAGGNAGVLVSTTNCTSVSEDTTTIPALATTGNSNITGAMYSLTNNAKIIVSETESTPRLTLAYSQAKGTWTATAPLTTAGIRKQLDGINVAADDIGNNSYLIYGTDGTTRLTTSLTDTTFESGTTVINEGTMTSQGFDFDNVARVDVYGSTTGQVNATVGWTGGDTTTFSVRINDFALSRSNGDGGARMICVGNSGTIGYWDYDDRATDNAWTVATNGFTGSPNIHAVDFNETDGMFVAVASNGQIARSTDGIN